MILLSKENADANLFITCGIIFVACMQIQLMLFLPKLRYEERRRSSIRTRGITAYGVKVTGLRLPSPTEQTATQPATTTITNDGNVSSLEEDKEEESFRGERVLANKSKRELAEEVQMLRRLLESKEDRDEAREEAECADQSMDVVPTTTTNGNGTVPTCTQNVENSTLMNSTDTTQTTSHHTSGVTNYGEETPV